MKQTSVYINSFNRSATSTSSSDFNIRLSRNIKDVEKVIIKSVEIPISYYPVNDNTNVITFTDNVPNTYVATLTNKNYTGDDLATEMQTKMNALLAGFVITYDEDTLKFTFTNSTNDFEITLTGTSAYRIIGLESDTTIAGAYTSENIVNLSGTNHIFLKSDFLSRGAELSLNDGSNDGYIFRVVVNEGFGSVLHYRVEAVNEHSFHYSKMLLDTLDFKLYDEEGNALDLNGGNWNIELLIFSRQD